MIIGKKIIRLDEIDSTNEQARRLIKREMAEEGLVILAERQSKGRGKPGRKWHSPVGNLYLSAVVCPRKNPQELAPITLIAAIAARAAIGRISNLAATIKWPNDLLVHGKKIGGILVERMPSGHLIIGIGINVNASAAAFPREIRKSATSLRIETHKKHDLEGFKNILLKELDQAYLDFIQST